MIHKISREEILAACDLFDKQLREQAEWKNWEQNKKYAHAIQNDRKKYPIKHVITLATGQSNNEFTTSEARNRLRKLGFNLIRTLDNKGNQETVEKIDVSSLKQIFETILADYVPTRQNSLHIVQTEPIWQLFENLEKRFKESSPVTDRPTIKVIKSVGKGSWAKIP